jgi:hemoglobin
MEDIKDREDLFKLINSFYAVAKEDALIGHFFSEVIPLDWNHHIPKIVDFWEHILFNTGKYRDNVMQKHIDLDKLSRVEESHFNQWQKIWNNTLNDLFEGPNKDELIKRAEMMKQLMIFKIGKSREDFFIQ